MMTMFSFNRSAPSNDPDDPAQDNPYRDHALLPGTTLNTYAPCRATFIGLPLDGGVSQKELQQQRLRWKAFLLERPNAFRPSDAWIWLNRSQPIGDPGAGPILKRVHRFFNPRMQERKRVKQLVRSGIPPELRGPVWIACSGAMELKNKTKKDGQYINLLKKINNLNNQIKVDIEKDLKRTFPDLLNDTAIINRLRNVLSVYALRNGKIGYCQSMNYLCAMILLHINDEEEAFWCFTALIELILPKNYYEPSLLGGKVDQSVFRTCIASKLPRINTIFEETGTILEPIICPWFLCVFLNILPLHAACRIWDCMFWEGSIVLFRTGLAMIKMKNTALLNCTDFISVYSTLKISNKKSYNFEISRTSTTSTSVSSSVSLSSPSSPTSSSSPTRTSTFNDAYDGEFDTPDQIEISDAEYLIRNIFGYKWLRSVPPKKIESLRKEFTKIFEKKENKYFKDHPDDDDDDEYDEILSDNEKNNENFIENNNNYENDDDFDDKKLNNSSFVESYVAPYRSNDKDDKTVYINNPVGLTNNLSPRMKKKLYLKSSNNSSSSSSSSSSNNSFYPRESEVNLLSRMIYSENIEDVVKISNEMKNSQKVSIYNQIKELAKDFDATVEEDENDNEEEDFSGDEEEDFVEE